MIVFIFCTFKFLVFYFSIQNQQRALHILCQFTYRLINTLKDISSTLFGETGASESLKNPSKTTNTQAQLRIINLPIPLVNYASNWYKLDPSKELNVTNGSKEEEDDQDGVSEFEE